MTESDRDLTHPQTPSSLDSLLTDAEDMLAQLLERADALPQDGVTEAFAGTRVADVLAHITAWHELLLGWVRDGIRSETPPQPAPGYDWDKLEEFNAVLVARYEDASYDQVRRGLLQSHADVCDMMRQEDEELLFNSAAHAWLGAVAFECLGNHYRWGLLMLDTPTSA